MAVFTNYWLILMAFLIGQTNAASFQGLDSLVEQTFSDTTSVIRLADQEKFSIPLNGRYISYDIKYSPESASNCVFREPKVEYKKLASSSKLFDQDDEIIGALILKREQKVVLADAYYNMVIYSTDEHKLLRLLSPKTSLISSNSKGSREMVNSLALLTTQQEDYIYYLTPKVSFVFSSKSFGTQMEKINIALPQIQKAIYYKSYIVILTPEDGTHVYKLNKTSHQIEKIQTIKNSNNHAFIDIQLDTKNQMFYILTESSIQVYRFDPSNFPNPLDPKEFVILRLADEIQLLNYTRNHGNSIPQNNQHTNLEIASTPTQTQLFVLFRHMRQNVIAEFVYDAERQQVNFLRYFKFQMPIKEIHTIEDVIVIVGEEVLGMFPYGIDPRLIVEQFNGWISLSDIQKIVITEAPFFVGISKNTIQYGGLMFSQQAGLTCQFNESSETKVITFHGNVTWCGNRQFHSYNNYCAYTKSFILESMQIVTSSAVSSSVWIAMIVCTGAIIFGILIMLIMHKKKEDEIKKLQTYFEERKRTQIPTTSDRRTTDHKL